jgi:hypothetical protein
VTVGAIAKYDSKLWKVVGFARITKTYQLANFEHKVEVPQESLEVVANPPMEWPFASPNAPSPIKSPIIRILRNQQELVLFNDWVPSDFLRQGPVFFSPKLKLRKGEVLTAVCQNNRSLRIVITAAFATVSKKVSRVTVAEPEVKDIAPWEDLI